MKSRWSLPGIPVKSSAPRFRFGPFELDGESGELRRGGSPVHLRLQAVRVLEALASQPGRTVSRAELQARVWSDDTFVDFEQGLNSCMKEIRAALGDSTEQPDYVQTLPRRGYRFIAPVETSNGPRIAPAQPRRRALRVAAVGAILLLLGQDPPGSFLQGRVEDAPERPRDAAAHDAYLRGLYLRERQGLASLRSAAKALDEATAREPGFAPAQAALAEVQLRLALHSEAPDVALVRAKAAARRALQRDPHHALAHAALGAALHLEWDFEGAEPHVREALERGPRIAATHYWGAGFLASIASYEEAIAAARRAVELDPGSLSVAADLGAYYLMAGRYDEAVEASRRSLELEPGFEPALWCLLRANESLGLWREARDVASALAARRGAREAPPPHFSNVEPRQAAARLREWRLAQLEAEARSGSPSWYVLAALNAELGRQQEALRWLRWAYDRREPFLVFIGTEPALAGLRARPEFVRLLRDVGIPDGVLRRASAGHASAFPSSSS